MYRVTVNRVSGLLVFILGPGVWLSACSPAISSSIGTPTGTLPLTIEPTGLVSPSPTPPPTFETVYYVRVTYTDEANGFKLDYPQGWTVVPNTALGSRGSQALLLSPGTTADKLASGGTRISITVYAWDPRNDLASFVTHQAAAWQASGFTTIVENKGDLRDGRKEMDFIVQTPDDVRAYFLFTTNGDKYLQIAGEGDLALVADVAHTLRPL